MKMTYIEWNCQCGKTRNPSWMDICSRCWADRATGDRSWADLLSDDRTPGGDVAAVGVAWISVKDRLPDYARDVVTYGRYGVHRACFEWGAEGDPCWWAKEVGEADFKESVTHWAEVIRKGG
jgi:hypothetical protein